MEKDNTRMYGKSIRGIDLKNRIFLPANYNIATGTTFGLIEESDSACRLYLYDQLVSIIDALQNDSFNTRDEEEKQRLMEKICNLLVKIEGKKKVDSMGRILISNSLITTSDSLNDYTNEQSSDPRVMVIGEGLSCVVLSNKNAVSKYLHGDFGCGFPSLKR